MVPKVWEDLNERKMEIRDSEEVEEEGGRGEASKRRKVGRKKAGRWVGTQGREGRVGSPVMVGHR